MRWKRKTTTARPLNLDRQIAAAKTVLRQLRDMLEDLDDRRELARAKKRNADKPGANWETVKKELGYEFRLPRPTGLSPTTIYGFDPHDSKTQS